MRLRLGVLALKAAALEPIDEYFLTRTESDMAMKNTNLAMCIALGCGVAMLAACGDESPTNAPSNSTNNATDGSTNGSTNNDEERSLSNYLVLIADVTIGDLCDAVDPGSDIVFVALEDGRGRTLAYGRLAYDATIENEYNLGFNLDGNPPWAIGGCPEFSEENLTSLGCGGAIGLVFENRTRLTADMKIRVSEFGSQCTGGPKDDRFEVFLCTDKNEVVEDRVYTSCTIALGNGSGEILVPVALD